MAKEKLKEVATKACSCGQELGDSAKVFPFVLGDERLCPKCVDLKHVGAFGRAVFCSRCGYTTLSQGVKRACAACNFPHVNELCPS